MHIAEHRSRTIFSQILIFLSLALSWAWATLFHPSLQAEHNPQSKWASRKLNMVLFYYSSPLLHFKVNEKLNSMVDWIDLKCSLIITIFLFSPVNEDGIRNICGELHSDISMTITSQESGEKRCCHRILSQTPSSIRQLAAVSALSLGCLLDGVVLAYSSPALPSLHQVRIWSQCLDVGVVEWMIMLSISQNS